MKTKLRKFLDQRREYLLWASFGVALVSTAVGGMLGGLLFGFILDLPEVEQLQESRPNIVSYVYSADGQVLGQFALEKRTLVTYAEIPEHLKHAILAAEDAAFFQHSGIDFRRLGVTIVRDILYGERKGASTLTMQLSKLLFTSPERTLERKIKDMLFALEIEKNYSKEQIFTFYCNQIYMGHGTYGVASAADFYFDKPLDEITVAEGALLAGIIQVPGRHSPLNHPKQSVQRRNLILQRMQEKGFIDNATLSQAQAEPLLVGGKNYDRSPASYFVEWVRQALEKEFSTQQIWEGGLKIYTTLDFRMQVSATRALREGLKSFDKNKKKWNGPVENILARGGQLSDYFHPEWRQIFYEGQLIHGLVLESSAEEARVRLGSFTARILPEHIAWTEKERVDTVLAPGDVAVFSISRIDQAKKIIEATLDRIPEVQGSLIALDNQNGAIRAMVGGFDFRYSKFNRSTQALRQAGSLFKPFTYVAAIESGYSTTEQILDAPISFRDGLGRIYAPENSDQEFRGLITIRDAFALSRNVPTIRLANSLGIDKVIAVAQRFGIRRELPRYLPVALGAAEITLEEITSAFSVFPNYGVRAKPYFIQRVEDYHGVTLLEHQNQFEQVISPETAEQMIYLLRNVVERGTARQARSLDRPLGGKTGTTNDSTDSWFVGFTPRLSAGVWTGYDEKISLGKKVYGATLALPIWIDFMQEFNSVEPVEDFREGYRSLTLNKSPPAVKPEPTTQETVDTAEEAQQGEPEVEAPASSPWRVEDIPPPARSL